LRLAVAGAFWIEPEKTEFDERIRRPDLQEDGEPVVEYLGFASGDIKRRLLFESDCMVFPTYYSGEGLPLVFLEGLPFALPPLPSPWRDMPEILPANSAGVVPPKSPEKLADALLSLPGRDHDPGLRAHFLANYTEARFAARMREVLLDAGRDA